MIASNGTVAAIRVSTATQAGDAIEIWKLTPEPRLLQTIPEASTPRFIANENLLTVRLSTGSNVLVDVGTGDILGTFTDVRDVAGSEGNQLLLIDNDVWIARWDESRPGPTKLQRVFRLDDWDEMGRIFGRSDGKILAATRYDDTVELWEFEQGNKRPFEVLAGHGGFVDDVMFIGKPGRVVATSSEDGTVRLWRY